MSNPGQHPQDSEKAYDKAKRWLMRAACTLAHSFRAIEGASRREPFNAVIAVATTVYVCFAALQWCTMRDQLRQMQSSSTQTDNMIAALQNQAASLSGQLASMKAFQRAFLSIETILDSTYDSGAVPKHYMRFVYVNSGNTPTRNLIPALLNIDPRPASGRD
jgi:hypothetical protein